MTEDLDSEMKVLSCCLMDGAESLGRCLGAGMNPEWFSETKHMIVFGRLTEMLASGKAIEVSILAQELSGARQLEAVGGFQFLSQLSNAAPTSAGFREYLARVHNLFIVRRVMAESMRLTEACRKFSTQTLPELLDGPVARILAMTSDSDMKDEPRWTQVVTEAQSAAEALIRSKELPPQNVVNWPWAEMDRLFEPMQRGQLIILGARPSVGKSSISRQVVTAAALAGKKVYLDTLEVRPMQVALQIAATLSGTGVRELARAHPTEQANFKEKLATLSAAGITPSSRDRSLARVVARIKALKAAGKIDLAVIDHGGMLDDVALAANKDEKMQGIGRLTKTLKTLAVDLDIVVLLLWQLNRLSANEGNREPRAADLRDSGSLEEDADKVLLIHRPTENPLTRQGQPEASDKEDVPLFFQNVIQAKGRDDGTSIMSFYFRRRTATFEPIVKKSEAGPQPEML
jgi:replicative DNA helicase